jgi:hypothetical protein
VPIHSGLQGVRYVVERTWTLRADIQLDNVREWESKRNEPLPDALVQALCRDGRSDLRIQTIRISESIIDWFWILAGSRRAEPAGLLAVFDGLAPRLCRASGSNALQHCRTGIR